MIIPEVQVFSWDTDVVGNCSQDTKITTSESSKNTSRDSGVHFLQKRNDSLSGSTAVIDGYTLYDIRASLVPVTSLTLI